MTPYDYRAPEQLYGLSVDDDPGHDPDVQKRDEKQHGEYLLPWKVSRLRVWGENAVRVGLILILAGIVALWLTS